MLHAVSLLFVLVCGDTCQDDEAKKVSVRFVGGEKTPLEGLTVSLFLDRGSYTEDKKKATTEGTTDKLGTATFDLSPGRYYVDLKSATEFPYLPLPVGHKGHPWLYERTIIVGADPVQTFNFELAEACKLTLRAVDADTGKGIRDVLFVTENATAEMWGMAIDGDNLGAKLSKGDDDQKTNANGEFTRLVGPRPGFTYFAWPRPTGYEFVGPTEVEIPTPVGTQKAEHIFKFRKKK